MTQTKGSITIEYSIQDGKITTVIAADSNQNYLQMQEALAHAKAMLSSNLLEYCWDKPAPDFDNFTYGQLLKAIR